MIANEPCKIGKVWSRCTIADELEHRLFSYTEDVQRQRTDRNLDHLFGMIKEFDSFGVERKVGCLFVEEEMDRVIVELQRESLQKRDVIRHHLFVVEIKLVHNDPL